MVAVQTDGTDEIGKFVRDLQRRGYTKYRCTLEVMFEFDMDYGRAYYRVRKYWNKDVLQGNKV